MVVLRTLFFLLLFSLSANVFSQDSSFYQVPKLNQQAEAKLDFLSAGMPNGETNMSLAGIHYNFLTKKNIYLGIGMYGSVAGERGGLFTLGVNAGVNKKIVKGLFVDAGVHFGGGGGDGAPDGGGAFILPHANVGYRLSKFSIEAGYSYINFFDKGNIESHQLNVALKIPMSYDYAPFHDYEKVEKRIDTSKAFVWNQKSNRISAIFHLNNLFLKKESKSTKGIPLTDQIVHLAGFEINKYFAHNLFGLLKLDGAYKGYRPGYMDILVGGGCHLSYNQDRTNVLVKFAVGAGGGGGVETDGGGLLFFDVSVEQKVFKNIYLFANKGYLLSNVGTFFSSTYGAGLKYYMNQNGTYLNDETHFSSVKFKGYEVLVGQEIYFSPQRFKKKNNTTHIQQILLQLNFYLNKNLYAIGQTSFANFGDAGAYAEGVVGGGASSKSILKKKIKLFAQTLVGAAGGGDIDTGHGLIIKPSIGIIYLPNDKLGIRVNGGQVKALGGGLNNPFVNVGLSYRFSLLSAQ